MHDDAVIHLVVIGRNSAEERALAERVQRRSCGAPLRLEDGCKRETKRSKRSDDCPARERRCTDHNGLSRRRIKHFLGGLVHLRPADPTRDADDREHHAKSRHGAAICHRSCDRRSAVALGDDLLEALVIQNGIRSHCSPFKDLNLSIVGSESAQEAPPPSVSP